MCHCHSTDVSVSKPDSHLWALTRIWASLAASELQRTYNYSAAPSPANVSSRSNADALHD